MATQAAPDGGEGKTPEAATQARVNATLVQARQHLIRNNAAAALALLKEIAALPDCPADIRLEAGKMLATAGANAEAAGCYLNAGLSYLYDHGDMSKARQAFASAHNLDPHNLDVIFHLGQADVVEGRTQDGLAKFIDVLRKSNLKHTPALFEAGCIYQANGQYDQAILAFKKVLDRDKKHIQAIVHMGQLHQIKGMVPEAISYYIQAAQITREEKQVGTTRQIANMVLAIDPSNHRARTLLADLEQDKEDDEEAAAETAAKAAAAAVAPQPAAARAASAAQAEPVTPAQAAPPSSADLAAAAKATAAARAEHEAARAEHETAIREAEAARKQAEAAAKDAEIACQHADEARKGAEVARERAEGELATLHAELERVHANKELAVAQTAKDIEAARRSAETELAQFRATVEREKSQHKVASAQAVAELSAQEQSAIETMVAKREAVQRELAAMQAKLETVQRQTEAARKESEAAQAAQQTAAEAAAQLDAELLALQEKAQQARAKQTDSERRASSSVAELEKKAQQLEGQAAAAQKRVQEAEQQAAQIQNNIGKAKAAHEAAMLEIAARRQKAQVELDKILAEVEDTARQKDAERNRAELTVAQLETKAEQLRKETATAEQRRAQTEAKGTAATAALKSLEERIAQAKDKAENATADLKDIMDQARSAQANSAELSSRVAELQAHIEAAESKKRLLEDSYAKVKPLVTAAERRRADAEAATLAAEKSAEAARKTADAAEKAAEVAQTLQAKREADAGAVQTKVNALAQQLKTAQAAVETSESKKRDIEEAFAKAKSLTAAAEQRRAQAEAAAEQAEAVRAKREAAAEALTARVAALENQLREADARAKEAAAEAQTLAALNVQVGEQRAVVSELEAAKAETERALAELRREVAETDKVLQETQAAVEAQANLRAAHVDIDAEAVAAIVPAETCVESLRGIESLAADGELELDIATELASLIHEGRAAQALRQARKRANQAARPAPYLLVCGDLCRDLGDIAAARDAYKMLAVADPQKAPLAQTRMGELFLSFAERSTAAALQRDDAHFAATGDPAKAIEAYAELVARFPEDASFREELGALHERLNHSTAAALAYTKAMIGYLGTDDIAHAVELAPRILAVHPQDGAAYELAARAYERAGNHGESLKLLDLALRSYREAKAASDVERVCRRLTEIAEDPVPYRKELAALLHEAGDISGAAEQLLEAAEKLVSWSRVPEAQSLLNAVAAWAQGDAALQERIAAVRASAAAAQQSGDDAARGALLVSKGQYERAAEAYRRALEENPHQAGASYQLACLLMDHFGDYTAAETLLQTSADLRPDHAATRYRLALAKAAQGRVVEAVELLIAMARFDESNADFIEQFAEQLERDAESGDVAAKYRLGIAYRELGRVDEALVILQSIQRQTEYVVLCHNAIGLCLRRQGLDTAAAKRFSKAIETPGYPETQYHEALYNLGDLYEAKDTAESLALALSSFEELYASDCTFKDVADRIKAAKSRIGAVERPKVKRLPTRSAEQS